MLSFFAFCLKIRSFTGNTECCGLVSFVRLFSLVNLNGFTFGGCGSFLNLFGLNLLELISVAVFSNYAARSIISGRLAAETTPQVVSDARATTLRHPSHMRTRELCNSCGPEQVGVTCNAPVK